MSNTLFAQVHEALGVAVRQVRALSGGCVGEVYLVELADGEQVVAKVDARAQPRLETEGYMLDYLARHGLPVPRVRHADPGLLLLEFVPGASGFNARAETHAAELLAALHAHTAPRHGLERATLIGALDQPNPWTGSWVEFFREHRLLHMTEEALREGVMPRPLYDRLRAFAADLERFLEEPEQPCLLHGDVWTTNVLADGNRISGFLDPAVYYGHPEIELAFITLFNTFGKAFFTRYDALRGIRPGFFEKRRDIYNFYPLLVHARMFGPSYLSGIERTLTRLGF